MKPRCLPVLLALLLLLGGCAAPAADADGPLPAPSAAPAPTPAPTPVPTPTVATLAVCGDAMSHMPVTNDAWDEASGAYDYSPIMEGARALVSSADFAVVNLETTLSGGPPYSGYPAFNSPDALARDLVELGFDLALTANNHSLDKGISGLSRTLDVLDEAGLPHVGTSRSAEEAARNMYVADIGGIRAVFLGYTYGTNGIPVPQGREYAINVFNTDYLTTLANPDKERLAGDLEAARALDVDLVAVMIHWGVEYQTTQNAHQEALAQFLFDNGADLILGGHPHVLQPMALRTLGGETGGSRQGFVCYSLGNFISSQNKPLTDTTAVLTLELTRDNVTGLTSVTDYGYAPMLMHRRGEGAQRRFELLDVYAALEAGAGEPGLEDKLRGAIEDCHAILGPEHDLGLRPTD